MPTTTSEDSIPLLAVHGVGNHPVGDIELALETTLTTGSHLRLDISESNWDQHVDQSKWTTSMGTLWSLQKISSNLHAIATLGIARTTNRIDAAMASIQLKVRNSLRYLIAVGAGALVALPAAAIVSLLPTVVAGIEPFARIDDIATAIPGILVAYGWIACVFVGVLLALGLLRALVQRSTAPFVASLSSALFTCLNPILILLSGPVSVNWVAITFLVGIFCVFGVFASATALIPSQTPMFSIWDDFNLVPYFLYILGAIALLELVRLVVGKFWHEGPIKMLLDIGRYLGEPEYRADILARLDQSVADHSSGRDTLILAAHSLGSVIAVDYLVNWSTPNPKKTIFLITMGSPFRRFFQRLFPGILFHTHTNATACAILSKYKNFRWLNVYRPWDYIGKSHRLARQQSGLDRSTKQRWRIEGHSGYWDDPAVHKAINAAWPVVDPPTKISGLTTPAPFVPSHPSPQQEPAAQRSHRLVAQPQQAEDSEGLSVFVLLPLILGVLGIGWMVLSFVGQEERIRQAIVEIDTRGTHESNVRVAHQTIPDVAGAQMEAHEFNIFVNGLDLPPIQLSSTLLTSTVQRRFDYRKLRDFIRDDCTLERETSWYEPDISVACTSNQFIEFRYLQTDNGLEYYFPTFRPEFYLRDLFTWIVYPFILIVIASIPAAPLSTLAAATFTVLKGDELSEADKEYLE